MIGAKTRAVIIVLGAVLSGTAPFLHMLAPKKSIEIQLLESNLENGTVSNQDFEELLPILKKKQKYLGYFNFRSFLYAIGTPIAMFYFSILMLVTVNHIEEKLLRQSLRFAFLISLYISSYLIIWVLLPPSDFPKGLYHLSIGLISFGALCLSWFLIAYRNDVRIKIVKLIHFISVETYDKYIRSEDKKSFVKDSYKVYDEITK